MDIAIMSEYNITINSLGVCIIIILQSGFSVSRGRLNDGDDDNSRLYSRYIACSPVAFHFTSSVRMCMTLLYSSKFKFWKLRLPPRTLHR